jgi:hypothetical protein
MGASYSLVLSIPGYHHGNSPSPRGEVGFLGGPSKQGTDARLQPQGIRRRGLLASGFGYMASHGLSGTPTPTTVVAPTHMNGVTTGLMEASSLLTVNRACLQCQTHSKPQHHRPIPSSSLSTTPTKRRSIRKHQSFNRKCLLDPSALLSTYIEFQTFGWVACLCLFQPLAKE